MFCHPVPHWCVGHKFNCWYVTNFTTSRISATSGIKLILCDDFVRRLRDSTATHYFVCVIKEAKTKGITATQIGSISSTLSSDSTFRIEFNNRFTLWVKLLLYMRTAILINNFCYRRPWMPHDFELNIEVYHLVRTKFIWPCCMLVSIQYACCSNLIICRSHSHWSGSLLMLSIP